MKTTPNMDLKKIGEKLFEDPLLEDISNPLISPRGITYDASSILMWLLEASTDPVSIESLTPKQLLPNDLVKKIKKLFNENPIEFDKLVDLLKCPLTKKIFIDPVVAIDGETYEHVAIEKFIKENPSFKKYQGKTPLYPNLFIKNLVIQLNLLTQKQLDCLLPLQNYLRMRHSESNGYFHSFFGRRNDEKENVVNELENIIISEKNSSAFFTQQHTLEVLNEGRLKAAAKPGLEYIKTFTHQA